MSYVFIVDTNKKPLHPVHPGRARLLLKEGKAAILKRYPFTLVLKREVETPGGDSLRVKLDPGSRTTGVAIVNDTTDKVVFAAELIHRGQAITSALEARRAIRRGRRARHTRYRKPRFNNRRRRQGWLAPSLESRVCNVLTWVKRFMRLCPIAAISMEVVRFDMQAMEQPNIEGYQYQQGTRAGYESREYLLEKCNRAKGTQDITVFLRKKPDVLTRILMQAKKPLKDAAAVNSTRWRLYEALRELDMPIECGSGGLTKFNRTIRNLSKAHWHDAACVGKSTPIELHTRGIVPLLIKATGRGRRQLCVTNAFGFPTQHKERRTTFLGYRTGDICKASTPKYMRRVHRADGYTYEQKGIVALPPHS